MRLALQSLITAVSLTSVYAGEPLIPSILNAILPKISSGMKSEEISKIVSEAYPKTRASLGAWSGQTGYLDFRLDERYRISIAASFDDQRKEVVHDEILIYVFDEERKNRVEIKRFSWTDSSKETPAPTKK